MKNMDLKEKIFNNLTEMENLKEIIRDFENTKYYGYLFYVRYDGQQFDSFDENKGLKSVKSEFRRLLEKNEIKIFKGIQQGGRTDKGVNALKNILYINTKLNFDFEDLKITKIEGLEIINIKKTLPFLEFPNLISRRFYVYEYPKEKIKNDIDKINKKCLELSGKKNFIKFTSKKGKLLKNHIREIYVKFYEDKLYFSGDGFLPQQVRIMSNVILNGDYKPLDAKYLTLEKIELSEKLDSYLLKKVEDNFIDDVVKIEKNGLFYIFYVKKENKSRVIGIKGKNIRELKKKYGNIVVKEL